ncbi:MAG: hypothetical protein KF726_20980 [Anaerolineae bacterium]|nr:hypothetical protein [Anaerolineae bacterium]
MLQRKLALLLVLCLLMLLVTPTTVVTASDNASAPKSYYEGITFMSRYPCDNLEVSATKHVDGKVRQTLVQVIYENCDGRAINATAVLGEDPDGLDVSRDLGWGGLQGRVTVFEQKSAANHVLEFHVSQFANTNDVRWCLIHLLTAPNDFVEGSCRNGSPDGQIYMDGVLWRDLNLQQDEYGDNYSNQGR